MFSRVCEEMKLIFQKYMQKDEKKTTSLVGGDSFGIRNDSSIIKTLMLEEHNMFDKMLETKVEKGVVIEIVERKVKVIDKHKALEENSTLLVSFQHNTKIEPLGNIWEKWCLIDKGPCLFYLIFN